MGILSNLSHKNSIHTRCHQIPRHLRCALQFARDLVSTSQRGRRLTQLKLEATVCKAAANLSDCDKNVALRLVVITLVSCDQAETQNSRLYVYGCTPSASKSSFYSVSIHSTGQVETVYSLVTPVTSFNGRRTRIARNAG